MPVDWDAIIEDAVQNPASAASDGRSASAHPLPDLLDAAEYAEEKAATPRSAWGRVRMARAITGGPSPQ